MNPLSIIILFSICFLSACHQTSQKHVYEEAVLSPPSAPMAKMMEDPHRFLRNEPSSMKAVKGTTSSEDHGLVWTVPEGWEELPGGGFRLASFRVKDDPE